LTTNPPSLYYQKMILVFHFLPSDWSFDFFITPPSANNWTHLKSPKLHEFPAPPWSPPSSLTCISPVAANLVAEPPSPVLSCASILSYSPVTHSSTLTIFRLPPFPPPHLLWIHAPLKARYREPFRQNQFSPYNHALVAVIVNYSNT
jgi:hypothetical protein